MKDLDALAQIKYEDVVAKLKSKNIKLTEIRLKVIKLIVTNQHLNMQQIIDSLNKKYGSGINVMSIYNTIDLLLKEHIIFSNTFDDKNIWYELSSDDIIHVKCDKCGIVQHVTSDNRSKLGIYDMRKLIETKLANVKHIQIEVHVICERCAS